MAFPNSRTGIFLAASAAALITVAGCQRDMQSISPLVTSRAEMRESRVAATSLDARGLRFRQAPLDSLSAPVMIFREIHSAEKYLDFITANLGKFRAMGYDAMAFELLPKRVQKDIDTYLAGGAMGGKLKKALFDAAYHYAANHPYFENFENNHYTRFFEAARSLGVKIHAIHDPINLKNDIAYLNATDSLHYAKKVAAIKKATPGNVMVFLGSYHSLLRHLIPGAKDAMLYDYPLEMQIDGNSAKGWYREFYSEVQAPLNSACHSLETGIYVISAANRNTSRLLPDFAIFPR